MKILQLIQMHLALNGYKNPNLRPCNGQQKWFFVEMFLSITSLYVYLLFVADSLKEYMDSILVTAVGTLVVISRISTILKMKTIFVFIDEVEKLLNASELKLSRRELFFILIAVTYLVDISRNDCF